MSIHFNKALEVDESEGNATSLICSIGLVPNRITEPTSPLLTIPSLGIRSNLSECLAKSAAGIGAVIQSLLSKWPVNQDGGAGRIFQSFSNPSKIGSQFANATRPSTFSQDIESRR